MNIDLTEIILGIFKSLFYGLILLLLALFLIPESWVIKVLHLIKPSIIKTLFKKNDKYFKAFLGIIIKGDYHETFVNDNEGKEIIEKIKINKKELDKIETNMFTIDLLEDLFETLSFSAIHYTMETTQDVIHNLANYFNNYSSRLVDTSYRKNFAKDILDKFEEMISKMNETQEYESEDKLGKKTTKDLRYRYSREFREYLKNEKEQLNKTRDLLKENIKLSALNLLEISK
ncbi:hypothetical protein M0M57_10180 [Flavobacterium azooxidireducens]|uniref:DUF4760 domain-containing protein n=1 Tax=Flavobacterium azooxidireducens TaxID=1871076 RepID=A0ABY4KCG4_9FLAO|nr:hypothetical protein [Flavobacterium azooxidireducens]UPQ78000.1 hypothetical protein M0M57_10180 [Flavobacterium azooxidireducens]